ncbi:MAG TPA: DUF1549 domain-containing protein [Gemmataceae bacterium]|nr:DUF1549 domain-containing protein [Gemmataceae bacterium]
MFESSRRRSLFVGVGLMFLCGMLAGPLAQRQVDAQVKKADPQPDPKKGDQKIDPKTGIEIKGKPDVIIAGSVDHVKLINTELEKKWQENKIEPAKRSTDYEFIRRVSLDIIGRIAKPAEIKEFMAWPADQRRGMLIEKLLKSEEYANNFANIFTNLLMTRTSLKLHHEQMQVWLTDEFDKKNADWSKMATSLISATGKTNGDGDAPAVNFILTHLGEKLPGNPTVNGQWDMVPVTSRITRLFLGLRTQCTQCHDHPFNDEWRQEHFWSINAYLRQVDAPIRPGMPKNKKNADDNQYELKDNPTFNAKGLVPYERRSGLVEYTKAAFLDGTKMPAKLEGTRRQELAKKIVTSPYFAKAFVNRMWGHFFGRGFTKDVDDFGDHSPPSHPVLLETLSKDWAAKYNHNPRELIRWICNSKAYGLESQSNKTNNKQDAEPFFSRMLLKAMTPEQLFDSLMTATDAKDGQNRDAKKKLRENWLNKLVVNFGDDEGNEGNFNGTVVQALLMMNGQEINNAIMDNTGGLVTNTLKKISTLRGAIPRATQEAMVKELFIAGLNRPPTAKELARMLDPERMKLGGPALIDYNFFRTYCQDLYWAMLNSNEFILNH